MIPSGLGLVNQECVNLIGSGTVVHIPAFFEELEALKAHGVNVENRLFISDRAHVVLDLHQRVDGLEEKELSGGKIGTTGKGLLPQTPVLPVLMLILDRHWANIQHEDDKKWHSYQRDLRRGAVRDQAPSLGRWLQETLRRPP